LFTNYEETGRDGAKWAMQDIQDVLSKNTCFIKIDRKGTGHYVDYIGAKKEFLNIFEERGLHKECGSNSDIIDLSSELFIASVNLACGYYEQHTSEEYLNIKELQTVIDLLSDTSFIEDVSRRQFKIEKKRL